MLSFVFLNLVYNLMPAAARAQGTRRWRGPSAVRRRQARFPPFVPTAAPATLPQCQCLKLLLYEALSCCCMRPGAAA